MNKNDKCIEVLKLFTQNYKLMNLISDAIYNNERYAYNTNFVIVEVGASCKIDFKSFLNKKRQTDRCLKISDKICIIEYPFISYIEASNAFDNFIEDMIDGLKQYKFLMTSLSDNSGLNSMSLIKKMVKGICLKEFQNHD
jgi:hypothetical protein